MARSAPERTSVDTMCDDVGQERLRMLEERLAPAASAARTVVAQLGQAPLARVEVKSPGESRRRDDWSVRDEQR